MSEELFSMPESAAPLIETLRRRFEAALVEFDKHNLAQAMGVALVPSHITKELHDARIALRDEEQRLASIGFR